MENRRTITVKELAKELNIGINAAYDLANSEDFPSLRIGNRIVIPVAYLDDWIKDHMNARKENR